MLGILLATALAPFGALSFSIFSPKTEATALESRGHNPPGNTDGNWLGWGGDIYNNRLAASDATINAANVASLHQVCHQNYSVGVSATPLVVNGVAYFPTWGGLFVAYDYHHCKVKWQANITTIIEAYKPIPADLAKVVKVVARGTPAINGNVLFIGTQGNALLLAFDKRNGKLLDQIQLNDHPTAVVTMSPTFYEDRIFVGTASDEESVAAEVAGYVCCSFIGNMNGLAFQHNQFTLLWTQDLAPAGANFSGVAAWGSQPPIDPTRKQVFIGTGNVYSVPDSYTACSNSTANTTSKGSDNSTDPCAPPDLYQESVIAFDTATGSINWFHELSPLDAWNVACLPAAAGPGGSVNPGACPPNPGPDADFGMAPSFVPGSSHTPSGEDSLFIGQKNGNLYGLSAKDGTLFWALATSPDGVIGGLIWGIAVDASQAYYTAANSLRQPWQLQDGTNLSNGAFGAASLMNGKIVWETQVPRNGSSQVMPSVVNDVVLTGVGGPYTNGTNTPPGSLIALNEYTGAVIDETMFDQYFQGGIAIAGDRVFLGTGYSTDDGLPGSFQVWKACDD